MLSATPQLCCGQPCGLKVEYLHPASQPLAGDTWADVPLSLSHPDIEFNVTGNYGSPMHVNHNANYSSMPSPDMDHADRKQHDQARRPLSVATDNMMLEFYKKDG